MGGAEGGGGGEEVEAAGVGGGGEGRGGDAGELLNHGSEIGCVGGQNCGGGST